MQRIFHLLEKEFIKVRTRPRMLEIKAPRTIQRMAIRTGHRLLPRPIAHNGRTLMPLTQKQTGIPFTPLKLPKLLIALPHLSRQFLKMRGVPIHLRRTHLLGTPNRLPRANPILYVGLGAGHAVHVLAGADGFELVEAALHVAESAGPGGFALCEGAVLGDGVAAVAVFVHV